MGEFWDWLWRPETPRAYSPEQRPGAPEIVTVLAVMLIVITCILFFVYVVALIATKSFLQLFIVIGLTIAWMVLVIWNSWKNYQCKIQREENSDN